MAAAVRVKLAEPGRVVADLTLRKMLGYNIKRAYIVIQADLTRLLEPFGLRLVTFSALSVIVDNPDIQQSQLARTIAIVHPNLVAIVDELETRQLVERRPAPGDRRARVLRATAAGRRLCEQATRQMIRREAAYAASVTADQREVLFDALKAVENSISEER